MARPLIGRTVRRLRGERGLTQAALATKLGISASYLNLIEHDERPVTASLLIKLTRQLEVGLEALAGDEERTLAVGLREALTDPLLGSEAVSEDALAAIAAHPAAARAILSLSRAWLAAREEGAGLALPSGRRIRLPQTETRDLFQKRNNYFDELERAAEAVRLDIDQVGEQGGEQGQDNPNAGSGRQLGMTQLIAERLRHRHGLVVRVARMTDTLRSYDPEARLLLLSDLLKRESRGFHMAFQLMLIEAHGVVDRLIAAAAPSSAEAAAMIRIALLNYAAAALLMPYEGMLEAATALRYDVDQIAGRFDVSFEQAAQRLSTLARLDRRGVPLFFLRVDAASNIIKGFAGAGFHFTQAGGSCPLWIANTAFATPDRIGVQVGRLPDGATFLCVARVVTGSTTAWRQPPPVHVVALGCEVEQASRLVYSDGIDLAAATTPIGLSCQLCDWMDCRSRALPPLHHRLSLDVNRRLSAPMVSSTTRPAGIPAVFADRPTGL